MRRELVMYFAVILIISGCNESSTSTAGQDVARITASGQCMKDLDCKGDRICESGTCKAPTVAPGILTPSSPSLHATASEPKEFLSLTEMQAKYNGQPYGVIREKLSANGYSPDKAADLSLFNMSVAGDAAACGTKGCSIPWTSDNEKLCIGVSINDNLEQAEWQARILETCD